MKKTWKRLCTGFLAFATVVTALPTIPVHAESKQYWTERMNVRGHESDSRFTPSYKLFTTFHNYLLTSVIS